MNVHAVVSTCRNNPLYLLLLLVTAGLPIHQISHHRLMFLKLFHLVTVFQIYRKHFPLCCSDEQFQVSRIHCTAGQVLVRNLVENTDQFAFVAPDFHSVWMKCEKLKHFFAIYNLFQSFIIGLLVLLNRLSRLLTVGPLVRRNRRNVNIFQPL